MIGFSLIYGIRLYYKDPIHPTFIPIAGGVFSATIAFAIVMTLRYVSGNIVVRVGSAEYEGATGPIILWCICFVCIVFGLNMMGITDATQIPYEPVEPQSITKRLFGDCIHE